MSNTTNRSTVKKTYIITNDQMLVFLNKIPTLKENNKNTEYTLSVQSRGDNITEGMADNAANKNAAEITFVNIHFSYDFVNDRWFLNDKTIEVLDLHRD